jgi:hypothetical protein
MNRVNESPFVVKIIPSSFLTSWSYLSTVLDEFDIELEYFSELESVIMGMVSKCWNQSRLSIGSFYAQHDFAMFAGNGYHTRRYPPVCTAQH